MLNRENVKFSKFVSSELHFVSQPHFLSEILLIMRYLFYIGDEFSLEVSNFPTTFDVWHLKCQKLVTFRDALVSKLHIGLGTINFWLRHNFTAVSSAHPHFGSICSKYESAILLRNDKLVAGLFCICYQFFSWVSNYVNRCWWMSWPWPWNYL